MAPIQQRCLCYLLNVNRFQIVYRILLLFFVGVMRNRCLKFPHIIPNLFTRFAISLYHSRAYGYSN